MPQADQAARRDGELDVASCRRARSIFTHSARRLPTSSITAPTDVGGTSITRYSIGSMRLAVDLLVDDARLADRQLVAFAAHVLQQDRQVQQAAAGDVELVALVLVGRHAQGDVRFQLLHQPIAQLPAGDVLCLPGRQNGESLMRKIMSSVGSSTVIGGRATALSKSAMVSPMSTLLQADHGADVAGADLVGLGAAQAVEDVELRDRVVDALAVVLEQGDALALADLAGERPGRWRCGRRNRCSRA